MHEIAEEVKLPKASYGLGPLRAISVFSHAGAQRRPTVEDLLAGTAGCTSNSDGKHTDVLLGAGVGSGYEAKHQMSEMQRRRAREVWEWAQDRDYPYPCEGRSGGGRGGGAAAGGGGGGAGAGEGEGEERGGARVG